MYWLACEELLNPQKVLIGEALVAVRLDQQEILQQGVGRP